MADRCGTPTPDAPELTEADLAGARRWREGDPVPRSETAIAVDDLRRAIATLKRTQDVDRGRLDLAIRPMENALADLEKALADEG